MQAQRATELADPSTCAVTLMNQLLEVQKDEPDNEEPVEEATPVDDQDWTFVDSDSRFSEDDIEIVPETEAEAAMKADQETEQN